MIYIRNFKGWLASLIFLVGFIVVKFILSTDESASYIHNQGEKFSTFYSAQYESEQDFGEAIDSLLSKFNMSLSPFEQNSIISAINSSDTPLVADKWLRDIIILSKDINKKTLGAFDPTISPMINSWGFGFKQNKFPTDSDVKDMMSLVGMDKIELSDNGKVTKQNKDITLNFSAIAKGYAVDLVASLLKDNGVENYLVNIGGEIACNGVNEKGEEWRVGIDKPEESNISGDIHSVLSLSGKSLATSGNYRRFKEVEGQKVWHIIDPRTGYPTQAHVLSATVIADDCATADAYATALMVLGVEDGMPIIEADSTLEAMIITPADSAQYNLYYSSGFKNYLKR